MMIRFGDVEIEAITGFTCRGHSRFYVVTLADGRHVFTTRTNDVFVPRRLAALIGAEGRVPGPTAWFTGGFLDALHAGRHHEYPCETDPRVAFVRLMTGEEDV